MSTATQQDGVQTGAVVAGALQVGALRYLGSALGGAVITIALFYLMQWLIRADEVRLTDHQAGARVDFVMVEEDEELALKDRKPPPPPEPDEPPPDIPQVNMQFDVANLDASYGNLESGIELDIQGGGFVDDGEYLPIVKVQPVYPRRAESRGIEGYVIVEYTVTRTGSVMDPVVIEADPPGVFDRAAIRSALKYKYKPKVINGEPVDVPGVRTRITFELAE